MNKLVRFSIVLAMLVSGACKAGEAGLCKPVCAEEKRICRQEAVKWMDHDAESLTGWQERNAAAREFGKGAVQTNQPVGPAVRNAQDRKMTRNRVCDDKYMTCTKACASQAGAAQVGVSTSSQSAPSN